MACLELAVAHWGRSPSHPCQRQGSARGLVPQWWCTAAWIELGCLLLPVPLQAWHASSEEGGEDSSCRCEGWMLADHAGNETERGGDGLSCAS